MYNGHMIRCDTPRRLRAEIHGDVVVIRHEDWRSVRHLIEKTPGIRQVQTYGEELHLVVDSAAKRIPQIGEFLRKEGLQGAEIRQAPARMEEAFISLIREREATVESEQEV
jgi:ABC-2 type transport system ATP-binding protein